jgi:hypothetical protein
MAAFEEGWLAFKKAAGDILVSEMSAQSPIGDSVNDPTAGTLAQSHSARDGDGGRLEIVSTDSRGPIAAYVIRGTEPHPIDPVTASVLHWVGPDGDVFASHVEHPGTQPNPYNERAWEAKRAEVVTLFKATVGSGMVAALLNPWRGKKL